MTAKVATALAARPWQVAGEMLKWIADVDAKKLLIPIAVGEKSIAFPRRSVKAGVDRTHKLCFSSVRPSIPGQPAGIHNLQFCIDLPPISNGQRPFFSSAPTSPDRAPWSAPWRWERPCGRGSAGESRCSGSQLRTPPKLRSQTGEIEHGFR